MAENFMDYIERFGKYFQSYRRDVTPQAKQYLQGLMQAGRNKNMERMADVVPDSTCQNLQHFVTNSKWNHRAVMDEVAMTANEHIGDAENGMLLIDETGFPKQGKMSAGVSRQWIGNIGKTDNGQVAVCAALSHENLVTPVDIRLFLPEKWANDPDRCIQAGIPKEEIRHRTKPHIALEMVRDSRKKELQFGWVSGDALYGSSTQFLQDLDDDGERFVMDVKSNRKVYLADPCSGKRKTEHKPVKVREIANSADDWKILEVRNSTRGMIRIQFVHRNIWIPEEKGNRFRKWRLLISRDAETGSDTKYSFSNAKNDISPETLARKQRQRYWIERTFEDAKGQSGMADYQMRKWTGWNHHMALVMMAMLFMMMEKKRLGDSIPLLSCADIEILLAKLLPRKNTSFSDVVAEMNDRHKRRNDAIWNRRKNQISMEELLLRKKEKSARGLK